MSCKHGHHADCTFCKDERIEQLQQQVLGLEASILLKDKRIESLEVLLDKSLTATGKSAQAIRQYGKITAGSNADKILTEVEQLTDDCRLRLRPVTTGN